MKSLYATGQTEVAADVLSYDGRETQLILHPS